MEAFVPDLGRFDPQRIDTTAIGVHQLTIDSAIHDLVSQRVESMHTVIRADVIRHVPGRDPLRLPPSWTSWHNSLVSNSNIAGVAGANNRSPPVLISMCRPGASPREHSDQAPRSNTCVRRRGTLPSRARFRRSRTRAPGCVRRRERTLIVACVPDGGHCCREVGFALVGRCHQWPEPTRPLRGGGRQAGGVGGGHAAARCFSHGDVDEGHGYGRAPPCPISHTCSAWWLGRWMRSSGAAGFPTASSRRSECRGFITRLTARPHRGSVSDSMDVFERLAAVNASTRGPR